MHYWPIAAKRTPSLANEIGVQDTQFPNYPCDSIRDTAVITDWSHSNLNRLWRIWFVVPNGNLGLGLQSNIFWNICITGCILKPYFNIFSTSYLLSFFLRQNFEHIKQIWFYSDLSFLMKLQTIKDIKFGKKKVQIRKKYERKFPVLWLFLATVSFYLNCLQMRSLHTHSDQLQNLQHSLPPLSVAKTEHIPCRLL